MLNAVYKNDIVFHLKGVWIIEHSDYRDSDYQLFQNIIKLSKFCFFCFKYFYC